MTNEETVLLIQKGIDTKDNLEKLYLQNKSLISQIAYRYTYNNDYDDLMQEGYLGLEYAAKHFDFNAGASFTSFAKCCISGHIFKYKANNSTLIRIPQYLFEKMLQYKLFVSDYVKEHGKDPDDNDIMTALDLSPDQVMIVRNTIIRIDSEVSLDDYRKGSDNEDDTRLIDTIQDPDDAIDELLEHINQNELKEDLWHEVDSLSDRESLLLHNRYQYGCSLKECGARMHISGEMARQIHNKAIKELRKKKHAARLAPYVPDCIESDAYYNSGLKYFKYTNTSCVEKAVMEMSDDKQSL